MKGIGWLILILLYQKCFAEMDEEVRMVADVISSMLRPTASVVATLCWPTNKKIDLLKAIADGSQQQVVQFLEPGQMDFQYSDHIIFVANIECPNVTTHFELSSSKRYFSAPYRWLIISGSASVDEIKMGVPSVPSPIADIDVLPDSEVITSLRNENGSFDLNLIYKVSPGKPWKAEYYGSWDVQKKLKIQREIAEKSMALRRLDLDGFVISICYVLTDNDSYQHLTYGINDHIDTITKVNFPTTNHLLDFLKAGRKYVFANTWGYNVNGSWNGMTGYLVRDEVEIGGSPMFFTSERSSIVQYITSPTPTRSKFVFQQPKLSYENNLFLLSFRTNVWYCSMALLLLIFICLFLVAIWEWKIYEHDTKTQEPGVLRAKLPDVAILVLGATCQQGSPVELKGSLGRIVMLVLFLSLMFLYTSYSANIVALLQSSSSQIHTLEDLLKSHLKFAVDDTVYNRYYFSHATERVRKALYNTKIAPPGVTPRFIPMEEGVKSIRKGLFAFHMETGVGYKFVGKYFLEGEKCGLKEIQYLQVIDPWLAVRRNTPYKELFKIGFKRINEHGLQSRENHRFYEKRPKCTNHGANFISVSMVDCYPALLVLFYGALFALFLLSLEILVYKKREAIRRLRCMSTITYVEDDDYVVDE